MRVVLEILKSLIGDVDLCFSEIVSTLSRLCNRLILNSRETMKQSKIRVEIFSVFHENFYFLPSRGCQANRIFTRIRAQCDESDHRRGKFN